MILFEELYSLSTENHGIITAAARKMHVRSKDLVRWVKSGRLRNSLYQIIDPFYCLACIGNDSCISH